MVACMALSEDDVPLLEPLFEFVHRAVMESRDVGKMPAQVG